MVFFSNLNVLFFELKARNVEECYVTCLLVASYKINNFEILKNNPFLVHLLDFFAIKYKCMIIIDVNPKIC